MKDKLLTILKERFEHNYKTNPETWYIKDTICDFARPHGYSYENILRRLREGESGVLSNGGRCEPWLEKQERKGARGQRLTYYRWLPHTSKESILEAQREAIRTFDAL